MSNPQKENGYTPIANELVEALAGIRIPGEAMQCLWVILRKTYGWGKKDDLISLSQFCLLSKMRKPTVCRSLGKLSKMNLIVIQKDNDIAIKYRFNKDFQTWRPLSKKITVIQKDNESLSKKSTTKETIQKHIQSVPKSYESKEFLAHYFKRYKELIGDKLPVHSDRIILPRIESTAELFGGYEKLKELLEKYLEKDDKFYKDNKWTLTCFLSENILNKLND